MQLVHNQVEESMSGTIKANKVYGAEAGNIESLDKHKRLRVKELNLKRRLSKDARCKKHTNESCEE